MPGKRPIHEKPIATATAVQPNAGPPEAISLTGAQLHAPALPPDVEAKRQAELDAARFEYDRDPHDEQAIIWLGRRTAYLGRSRQAIDIFSNGLAVHPDSYRLLRHRGHRYITTRQLDLAIADLDRAATLIEGVPDEIEPDGQPNKLNIPTSTSHTNILYHLGLAHYLKGEFPQARLAYERCIEFCKNDDMRVATAYWLYLTLRRLNNRADAQRLLALIEPQMDIIENTSYHRLLLMFKGDLAPEQVATGEAEDQSVDVATIGYGIGMKNLFDGDRDAAEAQFHHVLENSNWAAFGHIAAEAERTRMHR